MKNKIHTIEVENNEPQSVEKIIDKIRETKIIYVKNTFDYVISTYPITKTFSSKRWN